MKSDERVLCSARADLLPGWLPPDGAVPLDSETLLATLASVAPIGSPARAPNTTPTSNNGYPTRPWKTPAASSPPIRATAPRLASTASTPSESVVISIRSIPNPPPHHQLLCCRSGAPHSGSACAANSPRNSPLPRRAPPASSVSSMRTPAPSAACISAQFFTTVSRTTHHHPRANSPASPGPLAPRSAARLGHSLASSLGRASRSPFPNPPPCSHDLSHLVGEQGIPPSPRGPRRRAHPPPPPLR